MSTTTSSSSSNHVPEYPVVAKQDFGPFKEYSVIHTDRSLNLMSAPFGSVMRDLNALLKHTYHANKVAIIPGYVCLQSCSLHTKFLVEYLSYCLTLL